MPIPPGFAEVSHAIRHSSLSRPAFVTYGVDPSSADPVAVAAICRASFNSAGSVATRIDNECTIGPCTVRMGQDGGEALTGIDASTALGGAGGASVPANVAALIHKRTARGGRRGRGRMYLPWWIQESDVDERGAISSTTIGFMNTALATWLADLAADGCPMVVLHDPGRTPAGAPDVVTSLTVDPIVGTQRRRLGR